MEYNDAKRIEKIYLVPLTEPWKFLDEMRVFMTGFCLLKYFFPVAYVSTEKHFKIEFTCIESMNF